MRAIVQGERTGARRNAAPRTKPETSRLSGDAAAGKRRDAQDARMHREVGRDEMIRSRDASSPFKEVREVGSVGPAGVFGEAVAEIAGDGV